MLTATGIWVWSRFLQGTNPCRTFLASKFILATPLSLLACLQAMPIAHHTCFCLLHGLTTLLSYPFLLSFCREVSTFKLTGHAEKHPFSLTPWGTPTPRVLTWSALRVESTFPNNDFPPSDAWCGTPSHISVKDGECQSRKSFMYLV